MFHIRELHDTHSPHNAAAIAQVQRIMRQQIAKAPDDYIAALPDLLNDPVSSGFRADLFVAETTSDSLRGFALLLHATDLGFAFLEMIAAAPGRTSSGFGSMLYERVREAAKRRGMDGLLFECLTDIPEHATSPEALKQNIARLRFYERYGARPVMNSTYEQPTPKTDEIPLFLVYDPLESRKRPSRDRIRAVVRAILERKYSHLISVEDIDSVVESFHDDPITLRPPRYSKRETPLRVAMTDSSPAIPLIVSDQHQIHHVTARDYVESPVRLRAILPELERTGLFRKVTAEHYPTRFITAVHARSYVDYLRRASAQVGPKASIYPQVFPMRNRARPPRKLPMRAGYYCIDTFTPLNENAYVAAKHAVDCTLTAADFVLDGSPLAYALVRPPGHHAESAAMGGFCYFNNAAIAAEHLSQYGPTAVLDIDYHHGNGTQEIFYRRADVLTVSIHADPRMAYPFFSGFRNETGEGNGDGFNVNIPLPEAITVDQYMKALRRALRRIARFRPAYLVLSAGFDTAKGDPTATWPLVAEDFRLVGQTIGRSGIPTLIVQEGGYRTRTLGINARHFAIGIAEGCHENAGRRAA